MRWSWTIARIRGINVDIHATFLILLAWIALVSYGQARTPGAAFAAVLLTLVIFASVVLHEFGHAFVAAHYGIKTRSITLLPIGGIAHVERIPERPEQELAIAIAGPIVTIAIVIVLYLALRLSGQSLTANTSLAAPWSFAAQTMWVNIVLALFNLLPAFPMDGGRVLRALLAMRMSFAQATEVAARIGKVFALLFALVGLFVVGNPFLVVIAAFVWLAAAAEANAAQLKDTIGDVPVSKAMITEIRALEPEQPVSAAIEEVRAGFQHDFPVVHDHVVAGMLTREDLLGALAHGQADLPVATVMHRDFAATTPEESIQRAMERLRNCHCRTLPVMQGSEVVGLLTADKISEFVMIASASRTGKKAA